MTMEHKTVSSCRGTTHYWVGRCGRAEAKTLVFTHGLTADHRMFGPQVEHFQPNYHIVLWDVPLHGLSRPYTDFSYAHTAEELAAILDAEGIKKAVLVGMSMGGYPSQAFMERSPERVEGFVALDTTPFHTSYYSAFDLWCLRYATAMTAWLPDGAIRKTICEGNAAGEQGRAVLKEILSAADKKGICAQMEVAYGVLVKELHDITLTAPTLILVGEHDRTGRVKQYCTRWAEREGYPLVVIPNAAHMSNLDNAPAVNRAIEDFLQALLI